MEENSDLKITDELKEKRNEEEQKDKNKIVATIIDNFDILNNCLDDGKGLIDVESRKKIILRNIETECEKARCSSELAVKMYEKIKEKSHILKVTTATVPAGILPPNFSCSLHDVKVDDDNVFTQDEWIRENIPRGLNFIHFMTCEKEENFDFAIYGNKKYTGRVGDEFDFKIENNDIWKQFCIDSLENSTEVICMEKLDGYAAHFAVRKIGGAYYIIAGSKNVHLIFQSRSDIKKYFGTRFYVARKVASAVLKKFKKMDKSKLNFLKLYLSVTKMTVVCELLDPKNTQPNVDSSHFAKPNIFGLMMTSVPGKEKDNSLLAFPPQICSRYFKFFGISTPTCYSIPFKNVKEKIEEIRKIKNSEGYVLYYLINDRTVGIVKVKTIWYVVLRAVREKDIFFTSRERKVVKPVSEIIEISHKLIDEVQKWLEFNDDYSNKWKKLIKVFISWLYVKIKSDKIYFKEVRTKFPEIWKMFLNAYRINDDFLF